MLKFSIFSIPLIVSCSQFLLICATVVKNHVIEEYCKCKKANIRPTMGTSVDMCGQRTAKRKFVTRKGSISETVRTHNRP